MMVDRKIIQSMEGLDDRRREAWDRLRSRVECCKKCSLSKTRNKVVFGGGDPSSLLMFVGEGPGADEDEQGVPFVGRAGQLLTKILKAAGIERQDIYITNIVKCRPPGNRVPDVEEMMACDAYLQAQIAIMNPAILICLGSTPTKWILKTTEGITKLRGKWFDWKGIRVMPMFHPSYLLRYASNKVGGPKHQTWEDIQHVAEEWNRLKGDSDEG